MSALYTSVLEQQLAVDYACTLQEVRSHQNILVPYRRTPAMRPVGRGSLLRITVYREKLLVMADPCLLDACRSQLGNVRGTWLSEPRSLAALDALVAPLGQHVADAHHHYLPDEKAPAAQASFPVRWYEQDELERFRGDPHFNEALLFDPDMPDLLAVTAMDGDTILGMASATRNCERLWEIGLNVLPESRGRGVGACLTALLKDELLRRGVVPTYATAESHILSQRVAFRAGFIPAFYEVFTSAD